MQTAFFSNSQALLPQFAPQHMATTLWGCAKLGIQPPRSWLRAFLAASFPQLHAFKALELANLVFGLAHFPDYSPPQQYMRRYVLAVHARLPYLQVGCQVLLAVSHSMFVIKLVSCMLCVTAFASRLSVAST